MVHRRHIGGRRHVERHRAQINDLQVEETGLKAAKQSRALSAKFTLVEKTSINSLSTDIPPYASIEDLVA
jgi:hypothetical protein